MKKTRFSNKKGVKRVRRTGVKKMKKNCNNNLSVYRSNKKYNHSGFYTEGDQYCNITEQKGVLKEIEKLR